MNDEEKYLYDLKGYHIVRQALSEESVESLKTTVSSKFKGRKLIDLSFNWGNEWRNLIDQPNVFPFIQEILCENVRIDHAFCVNNKFGRDKVTLHHQAKGGFSKNLFHIANDGVIYSGLIGVVCEFQFQQSNQARIAV